MKKTRNIVLLVLLTTSLGQLHAALATGSLLSVTPPPQYPNLQTDRLPPTVSTSTGFHACGTKASRWATVS